MIFVDTGAWIALSDKSDQYHEDAKIIYTQLKQKKKRFLTTDYVIDETVTRLRYDAGHQVAVNFFELIEKSQEIGILRIISIEKKFFREAVSIFRKYNTAILSFTDCTSFAVCHKHKIYENFAFDKHFSMMGISLCSK
ncbi:PIN domain-containing protein [Candidatus Magnetomoraceae bacterium gMMP-1]